MRPYLTRLPFEEFWIALLNRSNKVVKTIQLSKGGISGTVVDIKKLYGYVLEYRAAGIILYHNHPSGSELPSEADKTLTQKICRMASVMDVLILDHIIVGDEKYFSFADHGML
jgi:DNA repair protein RadC